MSDETWNGSEEDPEVDGEEEDWGESAPVDPIREEPLTPSGPEPVRTRGPGVIIGQVAWYDLAAGYGFLDDLQSGEKIFVDRAALGEAGLAGLLPNQSVSFRIVTEPTGRQKAQILRASKGYIIKKVFFGTDRTRSGRSAARTVFGNAFGNELRFGFAAVAIPVNHEIGHLETPSILRLEFRYRPDKHITLMSVDHLAETDFVTGLRDNVNQSSQRRALVFIHGYNVTFESAVRRTAQLAVDLKVDGPAIAYSWSSHARSRSYSQDGTTNEQTIPFLERFLTLVAMQSGAASIYLVAHSMGSRALVRALDRLGTQRLQPNGGSPLFREAVLAAPDIDKVVFAEMAQRFRGTARRFTVYASQHDRALQAARFFHGYPRAGDAGDGITIVDGIDSIDASIVDTSLLGHSYYGDRRSILDDIYELISGGLSADDRFNLVPVEAPAGKFWRWRP